MRVDLVDCPVQRRCTVSLGSVHVGARGNPLERSVPITGLDQTGEGVIGGGSRAGRCVAKNDWENGTLHYPVHQTQSGKSEFVGVQTPLMAFSVHLNRSEVVRI